MLRYVIETKGTHANLEVSATSVEHELSHIGRTLEETATIFDGKKEELELHEVGTVAATRSFRALQDEGILSSSTRHLSFPLPPEGKPALPPKETKDWPTSSIVEFCPP